MNISDQVINVSLRTSAEPYRFAAMRRRIGCVLMAPGMQVVVLKKWLLPPALIVAALVAHSPALRSGFVHWDDYSLVLHNPLVQALSLRPFFSYDPELYVPLSFLSYQLERALFGFHPLPYHATNLFLHALNALLVFVLLRKLLTEHHGSVTLLAFFGALLFAVHPLHVEAVSWVSARRDLLMTTFALASLITYIPGCHAEPFDKAQDDTGGAKTKHLPLLFFLLALLSKPTAIILPLLLPLLNWKKSIPITGKRGKLYAPFFALSGLFLAINLFGQRETSFPLSIVEFLLLSIRSIVFTLQKFFFPRHLSILHPVPEISLFSAPYLLSLLVIGALASLLFWFRNRNRTVILGVLFFLLTLAPGLLSYMKSDMVTLAADHYAYLPSVGLLIALASFLSQMPFVRLAKFTSVIPGGHVAAALFPIIVLGYLSFRQSKVWKNSETLLLHAVTVEPAAHIAWNNLGFALLEKGNHADAEIAFTNAVALQPRAWSAHLNLATIAYEKGDLERAAEEVRAAAAINPNHPEVQFNLGGIHYVHEQWDDAIISYRSAIQLNPDFARAHLQLARTYLKKGMREEAQKAYQRAIELQPSSRGSLPELE